MKLLNFKITPNAHSAWRSEPKGEQLFAAICYQIQLRYGEEKLENLLQGYTENAPFLVVSDAMPVEQNGKVNTVYLKKPYLLHETNKGKIKEVQTQESLKLRKKEKKKLWYPVKNLTDLEANSMIKRSEITEKSSELNDFQAHETQMHNRINRLTNTTDDVNNKPFESKQFYYGKNFHLSIWVAFDEKKQADFTEKELLQVFTDLGNSGFGADSSTGKGLFSVEEVDFQNIEELQIQNLNDGDDKQDLDKFQWLILSSCSLSDEQRQGLDREKSSYRFHTHFGRHSLLNQGNNDENNHQVFKKPISLLDKSAFLKFNKTSSKPLFAIRIATILEQRKPIIILGQGLGGINNPISMAKPQTIHQGYTLAIGL